MIKKIVFAGVGFALLASPLFASAQTASVSSNTSLLVALEALVQQLEQELQQLIAAKSSPSTAECIVGVNCQNLNSGAGPNISACSAYADLKKGDTDATTNGQVSKLQAILGISPTTGYYGALTSIGYTNKCVGGNSQPTSVAGMSEYTDPNFGFSFWYPSSWSVTQAATTGGSLTTAPAKRLLVAPSGQMGFDVNEVPAPNGIVVASDNCNETYYFSTSAGQWMQTQSGCDSPTTTQAADVSTNTMGGLHEFNAGGNVQGTTGTVLPLSATNFVDVEAFGNENYGFQKYLADTIVATNPNVATPVATAQQTATIEAEANAYGVQTSTSVPTTSTGSNSSSGFTISGSGSQVSLAVGQSISDTQDGGTLVLTLNSVTGNTASVTFTDTENCLKGSGGCPNSDTTTKSVTSNLSLNQPAYSVLALWTPITLTLTSLTQNAATIGVVKPSGTIDQSSLTQVEGTITLTGTAFGVDGVLVSLSQGALSQDFNTGYVRATLSNGKWSAVFNNILAGTYSVYNLDAQEVANLGGGTLTVTAQ